VEISTAHKYFTLETIIIIFVSMVINFFIVVTFSHFSPDDPLIELQNAGEALNKSLGKFSMYIWALGLFSSGQSATMAGAITGQYIMDGFLNLQISRKVRVLIARLITLFPCLIIAKFANVEMVYIILNIVQFIQLPFVLVPLFKFVSNKKIMNGFKFSSSFLFLLKCISIIFTVINIVQIFMTIPRTKYSLLVFMTCLTFYIWALMKLMKKKIKHKEVEIRSFEMISSLEC
jgi:natural resistance-associated macrophage protein